VGGAADRTSFQLSNALVGNPPDAAGLEVSLAGPTLRAECDLACVVNGAPFDLRCGGRSLHTGTTFTLHAGDVLRIGGTPEGVRAYLCVRGGIQTSIIMGSRSTIAPVRAGDVLPCEAGSIAGRFLIPPAELQSWGAARGDLRVVGGSQSAWFPAEQWVSTTFTVTGASNRMGIRLKGEPFAVPKTELVSEPVCPGAVQVTRDGQCIILGIDGQTIGGYPKIAQVITADLDRLGQLRPGDLVCFQRLSLEQAENAYHDKLAKLRECLARLQLASAS
jgi:antagonist of KipI